MKHVHRRIVCVFLALAFSASAEDAEFVPLREARNPELQRALEDTVGKLGLSEPVKKKQLAIALAGITHPSCPRLAAVNGNKMMYAASLPKIAILLAAYRADQDGRIVLTSDDEKALSQMIRESSNRAATQMMNRVGRDYINELLQSEEYRLYDRNYNGGLWVGKPYSKEKTFRPDPLHNLSHGASAIQVARFFYLLETGRLLDSEHSARLKEKMSNPSLIHKFVVALRLKRPTARVFRKSGTWGDFHSDAALIEHEDRRYVAVAMAQSRNGEKWLRKIIDALDDLITTLPPPCDGAESN